MFFFLQCGPTRATTSLFLRLLDHTQQRTTVGNSPLDELPARRRDIYLTTHNTHNRQTDRQAHGGSRTRNLSRRAAADLILRPRGHTKPLAYHRENRHTNVVQKAEWAPYSVQK
jgi:hypothetical protein